jgi:hypothetical protein
MEVGDKHKIVTGIYRAIEEIWRMKAMKTGRLIHLCGEIKDRFSR